MIEEPEVILNMNEGRIHFMSVYALDISEERKETDEFS